jgi:hypothetical protein
MYGEKDYSGFKGTKKYWNELWCSHRMVTDVHSDLTCKKCGFTHDGNINGLSLRILIWWVLGRIEECESKIILPERKSSGSW